MKGTIITLSTLLVLAGCQSNPPISTNEVTETSRPGEFETLALQSSDFEYAARRAVDEFLASGWLKRQPEREFIVMMGEVVNDTTLRIDTASMTSRMKKYLVNSGNFAFTAAIGKEATETVKDYRQLSRSKIFNQNTGAKGKAVKPDLEMLGIIRQRTNVSTDGGLQQIEYEFDFRVVDLGSGLERFQAFIPIDKLGSNKNFAW